MNVLNIRDKDDGSCELDCEFADEEVKLLLNYAVVNIIREYVEKEGVKHE